MKTLVLRILGIFSLLIITISCGQSSDKSTVDSVMNESTNSSDANPQAKEQKSETITERKLIKQGWVEFQTDDLLKTKETIQIAVKKYNAYISRDEESRYPGRRNNTIVVRVPFDSFDKLLNDITQGIKKFDQKNINIEDVTSEYIDLEIRIKNKKEVEQRYVELLKQAKNVTEILEIEAKLGEQREEIEAIEGRLKYLNDQTTLSTLTITFYEDIAYQYTFGQSVVQGFREGFNRLMNFVIGLIYFWPFLLIGGVIFYYFRRRIRIKKGQS